MGARNFGEMGVNLQKICTRLLANENLLKLLEFADGDPLSHRDLTKEEAQSKLHDLVRVKPIMGAFEDSRSRIAVYVPNGHSISGNNEYRVVVVHVDVFVPTTTWLIKDSNLRPFAIMGEIQSSLDNKTINGLGKMECGDFDLTLLTEEMSVYRMYFRITDYA